MSVKINGRYIGTKKVELIHEPSGETVRTDAPRDNGGEGSLFSPTDLVAAALGSCAVTTIAIVAERSEIDLEVLEFSVEKEMSSDLKTGLA